MSLRRSKTELDLEPFSKTLLRFSSLPHKQQRRSALLVKKQLILEKADTILASSRQRPTKLRCTDLWSKSMKKEAVKIMWDRRDPRVLRLRWRYHNFSLPQIPEVADASLISNPHIATYIHKRSIAGSFKHEHSQDFSDWDMRLKDCARLQMDLKRMRGKMQNPQPEKLNGLQRPMKYKADMEEFIKDEVRDFKVKRKAQFPQLINKAYGVRVARKMEKLGISFYVAQRRHHHYE